MKNEICERTTGSGTRLISCDYLAYGDYDNSCAVERANVRYLEKNNNIYEKETGVYGYVRAWVLDCAENRELLNGLFGYPCLDDELVSTIETEIEIEYIKDNDDIWRVTPEPLRGILEELDMKYIDPDIYYVACEEANMYFEVQSGGTGWIDLDKLAPTYNNILLERNPAIKMLVEKEEQYIILPEFPIDFYESAKDMLDHRQSINKEITQEEIIQILQYTTEFERSTK